MLTTGQTKTGRATKTSTKKHLTNLCLNDPDFLNQKLLSIPASTAGSLVGCTRRELGRSLVWGRGFVGKQDAWLDNCIRRVELVWEEHQQEELQDLI